MDDTELKICVKRRYETKEEADEAIKHTIRLDWSPKLRSYKCHICGNWHMTSKAY